MLAGVAPLAAVAGATLAAGAALVAGAAGAVVDGLGGVEPQAVQVVFVDPVGGVGDEQLAHLGGTVEMDRPAPLVRVQVGEVAGRELIEVVAVGAKVVVDHVEDDGEAELVRAVDEPAEVVRLAVETGGSEQVDTVVAPAEPPRELGDRHHLQQRDAEIGEAGKPARRRRPGPLAGEGTDVHLVEHLPLPQRPAPAGVAPAVGRRVHHPRGTVRAIRLETRGGVGEGVAAVEAKAVEVAGGRGGGKAREISAARLALELELEAGRPPAGRRERHRDAAPGRRPDAKPDAAARHHLGADRQPPLPASRRWRRNQRCRLCQRCRRRRRCRR